MLQRALTYKKPAPFMLSDSYMAQMLNAQKKFNEMWASIPPEDIESVCMDEIILKPKGDGNATERLNRGAGKPRAPEKKRCDAHIWH